MQDERSQTSAAPRGRATRRKDAIYRKIYNETPVMMHSIDTRGRIASVNDFWLKKLGYRRDEVLGRRSTDFLTEESRRYATEIVLPKFFADGTCQDIPYQMVRKDGQILDVVLSATAERNADGQVVMSRAMIFDVSEMRRAEEERESLLVELEAKNAELERFSYSVSHDLKSPLITISGFLGLLEKDVASGDLERMHDDISRIRNAVDQMHRLLEELLELSRIGRVIHPSEEVSLAELARQAVDLLPVASARAELRIEIDPELPTVRGDRLRLVAVFQNLLGNAIKFLGDQSEPRIFVGCREAAGGTTCFVCDNGIGIDPRYHAKIFGIFERLDPSATQGTGIGLALAQRIIEIHGGQIWVESEGLGQGSTFCFSLPAASD